MTDVRLWFSKMGEAKYISHLDLYRFMLKAVKRTGLPVWYTEGFNPHIYINFALPLSLGQCGENEIMDIRLTGDVPFEEIKEKLNNVLPGNIRIIRVSKPVNKPKMITSSVYEMILSGAAGYFDTIKAHLNGKNMTVIKKSKKGQSEINLSENIIEWRGHVSGGDVVLMLKMPTGTQKNINPALVADFIKTACNCQFEPVLITRRQIYMQDDVIFE